MCGPQRTRWDGVTTGVGNSKGKGLEEKWFPTPGSDGHTGEAAFDKPRDKPRRDPRSEYPLPHSPRLPKRTTGGEGYYQQPSKEAGLAILGRNNLCRRNSPQVANSQSCNGHFLHILSTFTLRSGGQALPLPAVLDMAMLTRRAHSLLWIWGGVSQRSRGFPNTVPSL